MKYLFVFALVCVVFAVWRSKHTAGAHYRGGKPHQPHNPPPAVPTQTVACDVCQLHLPLSDALAGPHGVYCSEAHRQQAGR